MDRARFWNTGLHAFFCTETHGSLPWLCDTQPKMQRPVSAGLLRDRWTLQPSVLWLLPSQLNWTLISQWLFLCRNQTVRSLSRSGNLGRHSSTNQTRAHTCVCVCACACLHVHIRALITYLLCVCMRVCTLLPL